MDDRIKNELALLRKCYSEKLLYLEEGQWVLIEGYPVPPNLRWNRQETSICFQIPAGYPGTPPYGFYVPSGIQYEDSLPNNYKEPADNRPPFPGEWGLFSWSEEGWRPGAEVETGSNLLNYVRTFKERFLEGR